MVPTLICCLIGHRVVPNKVEYDGSVCRTCCERCVVQIVRDKGGWHREHPD
jgi:hypothetical protein